jgi:hypothetical protein
VPASWARPAGSTSTARATAINGGDGVDGIEAGKLTSKADSSAAGVSVSATLAGDATLGSFIDSLTKAEAFATGIAGGAGGGQNRNRAIRVNRADIKGRDRGHVGERDDRR